MKPWIRVAPLMLALGIGRATAKPISKVAPVAPRVSVLKTQSNDTQELLDVKTWEFDVRYPAASRLTAVLELRKKGRVTQEVFTIGQPFEGKLRHVRLLVSVYPPGGSLTHSSELKFAVRVREYRTPKKAVISLDGSIFHANPFNGLNYTTGPTPLLQKDGSFVLIGGGKHLDANYKAIMESIISGHPRPELLEDALTLRFK